MNKLLRLAPALVLCAAVSAPASAQTPSAPTAQASALTRLLSAPEAQEAWFTPEFLAQVPLETIRAQLASIRAQFGAFVRLDTLEGRPLAVYERGTLVVTSAPLDAQGRLNSFGAVPGPAPEGQVTPAAQSGAAAFLTDLFAPETVDVTRFSPAFLAQVPEAELVGLFAGIRAENGKLLSVEARPGNWRLNFERGKLDVTALQVNAQGQVEALMLAPAAPDVSFGTLEDARAAFAALPGQVSLLVREVAPDMDAPALATLNAARPLAVGSAFKLAILGELQAQVSAGQKRWTDEVTLTDAAKSLPSGTLQDAPAGSTYTLRDLAARMIRDSDNTATDLLLASVGRAGVEARLGQSAMPSTREFFALKDPANVDLLRAYRSAGLNRDARRAVLAQVAALPLPNVGVFVQAAAQGRTTAQDVEWFVSTERLCALMNEVAALPETQLNPGVAAREDFSRVSYKGGSEAGVLNLTTQVVNRAGKTYCVSATWNRPEPLNEQQFIGLYAATLKLLR